MGFTTKEEFIRDAIRFRLERLKRETECVEVPRDQYEQLGEVMKEMNAPYQSVEEFINSQISEALAKYEQWKKTKRK